MPRWEPDARQRLRTTALELFAEHGYENVSAEQIAAQAGLTRRTFFRHFSDKRDVLFAGSEQLPGVVADAIRTAPGELDPADAARAGLLAVATRLEELLEPSPTRLAVIASSPELQERESWKHEAVAEAITVALRERRADDTDPVLLGRVWSAVLRTAFERWVQQPGAGSLADRVQQVSAQLSTLWPESATR